MSERIIEVPKKSSVDMELELLKDEEVRQSILRTKSKKKREAEPILSVAELVAACGWNTNKSAAQFAKVSVPTFVQACRRAGVETPAKRKKRILDAHKVIE